MTDIQRVYLVLVAACLTGCGQALPAGSPSPHGAATDVASALPSDQATPQQTPSHELRFPGHFVEKMGRQGYVLVAADPSSAVTSEAAAVESAAEFLPVGSADDPTVAGFFLVTTPNGGRLSNPDDPSSEVVPELNRTPMWVVYSTPTLMKDANDESKGFAVGHAVTFVDDATGMGDQAITW